MKINSILKHYASVIAFSLALWGVLWIFALMLTQFNWDSLFDVLQVSDYSRNVDHPALLPIFIFVIGGCTVAGYLHYKNILLSFAWLDFVGEHTAELMSGDTVGCLVGILLSIAAFYLLFIEGYILWPIKKIGALFGLIGSWPLFLQIALGVIIGGGVVALMLAALLRKGDKD